jgi:two-component system KDP operon response regulator KdpE
MSNEVTILIIDDERQIRKLLEITLKSASYNVIEAATGKEGLTMAAMHPPDLILLDLGLPDDDGQHILVRLREWYLSPIIILSVRDSEEEIVKALDNGANDYLVKPFRTGELLARIRNALVRIAKEADSSAIIQTGNLIIDLVGRTVTKSGAVIKLTATEYSLLTLLARNHDKVLTHQYILKEIWGPGYIEQSQYLRVFIAQIRKKIEDDPDKPAIIVTESRIGYRFIAG